MTTVSMEKKGDTLSPVDADSWEAIRHVPDGTILTVKYSVPRNMRQLRLYFAMIKLIFEHQREPRQYPTPDALREGINIAMGHCHEVRNMLTGEVRLVADSISAGAMDQLTWKHYFDSFKDFVNRHIVPGINSRDFDQALADMLRQPGPDQI